jgi:hypothetical protein
MEKHRDKLRLATIALLCFVNVGFGFIARQPPMLLAGAVGLNYVILTGAALREHAAHLIGGQFA